MEAMRKRPVPGKKRKRPSRVILFALLLSAFLIFWFLTCVFLLSRALPWPSTSAWAVRLLDYNIDNKDHDTARTGEESLLLSTLHVPAVSSSSSVRSLRQQQAKDVLKKRSKQRFGDKSVRKEEKLPVSSVGILHSGRASFFNNAPLLLNLTSGDSCQGKEELLSILYAASAQKRDFDLGQRKSKANRKGPSVAAMKLSMGLEAKNNNPGSSFSLKAMYQNARPANMTVIMDPRYKKFAEEQAKGIHHKNGTIDRLKRSRPPQKLQARTFRGTQRDILETCPKLPKWQQVTNLYGKEAIVLGMDTCAAYRRRIANAATSTNETIRPKVRIAGLFNSGTTVLSQSLHLNFPEGADRNTGVHFRGNFVEWDVPWGKHVPPKYKWRNKHPVRNKETPQYVLPVVIVRDPYRWMNSMCKEGYDAVWDREEGRCPSLVRSKESVGESSRTYSVNVTYQQTLNEVSESHASLSDYWSDWIRNYYDLNDSRLFVRFEDLLFHAEDLMYKIAECVGLEHNFTMPYMYATHSSKRHGHAIDFYNALTKFGHEISDNMTKEDLDYAKSWSPSSKQGLDAELMAAFHYRHPGDVQPPNS